MYHGDPQKYHGLLESKVVGKAVGFGGLVEIEVEDAVVLVGDGVNLRYHGENEERPHKHQLLIELKISHL